MSLFNKLKKSSSIIRNHNSRGTALSLHISGATGIFNVLLAAFKIITSVLALSIFICMNGLYTLGMVTSRYCALVGELKQKKEDQFRLFYFATYIMFIASLLYIAYSVWTIWHAHSMHFDQNVAIIIATVTFTEIGWNIYGIIKYRHDHSVAVQLIKIINLGTAIISLELTQAALLGMSGVHNPSYNGVLGVIVGCIAALLACFMYRQVKSKEQSNNEE